jgi:hypothetical protein
MNAIDLRRRERAYSAIQREGASVVLKVLAEGVYDPATAISVDSYTSYPLKALWETSGRVSFGVGLAIDSTRKVTIAAQGLPVEPKPGDLLTMDSIDWQVLASDPVYSHDVPIIFTLRCNK